MTNVTFSQIAHPESCRPLLAVWPRVSSRQEAVHTMYAFTYTVHHSDRNLTPLSFGIGLLWVGLAGLGKAVPS